MAENKRIQKIVLCVLLALNTFSYNAKAEEISPEQIVESSDVKEDGVVFIEESDNNTIEEVADNVDESAVDTAFVDEHNEVDEIKTEDDISEAFKEDVKIDDMIITVSAQPGVIPSGSTLSVKKVSVDNRGVIQKILNIDTSAENEILVEKNELDEIEKSVEELRPYYSEILSSFTFDITVLDSSGNEIQPNGKVEVSFSYAKDFDKSVVANIYHIEKQNEEISATKLVSNVLQDETIPVIAESDGFSYYQVEFTYSGLQYVLASDTTLTDEEESKVRLNEVLESLDIYGTVENYEVSDSSLFSVESIENEL